MPGSTGEAPAARYRLDAEVVHDEVTGLEWQRYVASMPLLDEEAATYCAALRLGGHCDWRLPTRVEGVGLLDLNRPSPSFNPEAFPEAEGALVLWSGSTQRLFRLGSEGSFHVRSPTTAGPDQVRCVRAGVSSLPGGSRYELSSDLVRDLGTGLVWARATTERTYADAASECAALQTDGGGFRVPTLKELQTLIDDSRAESPWIDRDAFPNLPPEVFGHIPFWTSSLEAGNTSSAWLLDFATGTAEATGATVTFTLDSALHVRCVR